MFEFVLARELCMPVSELDERLSELEYNRWKAFYRLEWERSERANQRANNRKGR
jgi:hypothetical protein